MHLVRGPSAFSGSMVGKHEDKPQSGQGDEPEEGAEQGQGSMGKGLAVPRTCSFQ